MTEITVWERIKETILDLGGKATYTEIIEHIAEKWPGTNPRAILTEIFACTVNHNARVHYKAREEGVADKPYDFLYQPKHGMGYVEWYEPGKHGVWGNELGSDGKLRVKRFDVEKPAPAAKREKVSRKKSSSPKTRTTKKIIPKGA